MIMNDYLLSAFMFLLAVTGSCGHTKNISQHNAFDTTADAVENDITAENIDTILFPAKENSVYQIKKDFDLGGKTYLLPKGVTIKRKKGVIKNGTLIGSDTKIEGILPVFDKVTIKGDWIVHDISTKMFKDLSYDNSLRDVMALTNVAVSNHVEILEGVYYIKLTNNLETGIYIMSNTKVVLDGEIRLKPNGFTNYHVVELTGRNCSLNGNGMVIGDKQKHTGTMGEWGMGVDFAKAEKASVSGITIKDCWGDCIYVGDESKNVTIENCILDNGRRQGISITSADSVWIKDCVISNVSGTAPQYAIDIEPNANQTVSNVTVINVRAVNCVGGFEVWGKAKNAKVKNVVFSNCTSVGTSSKYPILLMAATNISVENCYVDSNSDYDVLTQEITSLKVRNNTFKAKGKKPLNEIQCKKVKILNNQNFIKK